jgi:hypothetical protein
MRFDLHRSVHPHGSVQRSPHRLLGGSMARFRRVDAAYAAYDVRNELVNLLIAAETAARVSDGQNTSIGGITFHSHRRDNVRIVTWPRAS